MARTRRLRRPSSQGVALGWVNGWAFGPGIASPLVTFLDWTNWAFGPGIASRFVKKLLPLTLLLPALLLAAGCGGEELDAVYGRRQGHRATKSVNGTAVLAGMFQAAGHKVFTARRLSDRLANRTDCIVWFPDEFKPPTPEVRQWMEDWLSAQPGRTLIYVGRDFDAALWYWKSTTPGAPAAQKAEYQRRLREARADYFRDRSEITDDEEAGWFRVESGVPRREVRTLQGEPEWTRDVDPTKLQIELRARLLPLGESTVLLESDGDPLVYREPVIYSQILVVQNGSFLLNLPLINHEHRKLAGKLIDQIGPPPKQVVFLESRSGGPPLSENDPLVDSPTGLEIFHVWPTNWILLHLAIVGVLFCYWRFPIFGLPRRPKEESPSDFGRHVAAVAELLKRSGDTVYAQTRLAHYQQVAKQSEG